MRGKQVSPPGPLPQCAVWESLGSDNSCGRNESGLSRDVTTSAQLPPPCGRVRRGSIQNRPAPWPTLSGMPCLVVHGGAGAPPMAERPERQAAVERALDAGWKEMRLGALEA